MLKLLSLCFSLLFLCVNCKSFLFTNLVFNVSFSGCRFRSVEAEEMG